MQVNDGLVGNWSPGIGDPTMGGWLTVLLYVIATWAIWQLLRQWNRSDVRGGTHERWFWRVLLVGLALLTVNKQLDLQSALTEFARILADRQGWYADRRSVQLAFIAGVMVMGLTLFALTLNLTWGAPSSTLSALLGTTGLLVFVVVRAASFHHVDTLLGRSVAGLQVNWLMEMGGLLVIIGSARRRRGQL